MADMNEKIEKLKYKTVDIPRLTWGNATNRTELIGSTGTALAFARAACGDLVDLKN